MSPASSHIPDRIRRQIEEHLDKTLSDEQKSTLELIAGQHPVSASLETLFEWMHDGDFTNALFGALPDTPFPEYANDSRHAGKNKLMWKGLFVDDLAAALRHHLFGHLSDQQLDPAAYACRDQIIAGD